MSPLSAEQLSRIESLGLNCELGNVLRRLGNETPSLFRYTFTPPTSILDLLRSDFAGFYEIASLTPGYPNEVLDTRYNVWFHTNVRTGDPAGGTDFRFLDPDEVKRNRVLEGERNVIQALVERFRKRMRTSGVLFVLTRHDREPLGSTEDIAAAIKARARRARFTLLEVFEASDPSWVSRVSPIGDNMMRGYVARFAPRGDANDVDMDSWTSLLENALALTEPRPFWRKFSTTLHNARGA